MIKVMIRPGEAQAVRCWVARWGWVPAAAVLATIAVSVTAR